MALTAARLWERGDFNSLPYFSRYLCLYLLTNPSKDKLGVTRIKLEQLKQVTGLSKDQLSQATKDLMDINLILFMIHDNTFFFIFKGQAPKQSKSPRTVRAMLDDWDRLPVEVQDFMKENHVIFDKDLRVPKSMMPKTPTAQEVTDHAYKLGYDFDGSEFVDYYSKLGWKDSRGNYVRNWQQKLEKVWLAKRERVPVCEDAPKGFERFFAVDEEGNKIFPTSWEGGKPKTKDFLKTKLLRMAYDSKRV